MQHATRPIDTDRQALGEMDADPRTISVAVIMPLSRNVIVV